MAIEIKRSPVLSGKAAEDFIKNQGNHQTKESKESIATILANTKQILANYKSGK